MLVAAGMIVRLHVDANLHWFGWKSAICQIDFDDFDDIRKDFKKKTQKQHGKQKELVASVKWTAMLEMQRKMFPWWKSGSCSSICGSLLWWYARKRQLADPFFRARWQSRTMVLAWFSIQTSWGSPTKGITTSGFWRKCSTAFLQAALVKNFLPSIVVAHANALRTHWLFNVDPGLIDPVNLILSPPSGMKQYL